MNLNYDQQQAMFNAYILCALWSSTDDSDDSGGDPLDKNYGPEHIDDAAKKAMYKDCIDFTAQCDKAGLLASYDLHKQPFNQFGHDYWLTRNSHGTGFWDRDLGDLGDQLTKLCEHQEASLYIGDDGKLHYFNG